MNDDKLDSPEAIKSFLSGTDKINFQVSKTSRYEWVACALKRTATSTIGYFIQDGLPSAKIKNQAFFFLNNLIFLKMT